jgi:tetratricopeptide (TPR) repeat protein
VTPNRDPAKLFSRAASANASRRYRHAIQLCDVALNRAPSAALKGSLYLARATALCETGEWARAEADCRRALRHDPTPPAQVLLARCLLERGQSGEAAAELEHALDMDQALPAAWLLYARALSRDQRHDAAIAAAERARQHDPGTSTLMTLFAVLATAGKHEQLVEAVERKLESSPDDADLLTTLGISCNALGRSEAAIAALSKATGRDPTRADAQFALGTALMRVGRFAEGFRCLEHRQHRAGLGFRLGVPAWLGEPLTNKHLMLLSEQGLGDKIQFARFVPLVRRLAARTTFFVPRRLVRLFRSNPSFGDVETGHPGFRAADCQAQVMSLPHWLGLGEDLRTTLPCLFAEPELVSHWQKRLPRGRKIALAWQGNPNFAGEPWRSMPFAHFAPLFARCGSDVTWLSLQKDFGREQLRASGLANTVIDLADQVDCGSDAFVDSLAVLSLVDLFITTDSSLAHLAGSASVRTWLLLSEVADWRWGLEPKQSVWYPTLRLFRQCNGTGWEGVMERVAAALCASSGELATPDRNRTPNVPSRPT